MRYVEYDEEGNLFHICEALISPPPGGSLFMSDEQKAEHERRVAEHLAFGRALQLASLIDSHQKIQAANPRRGIHVLPDDAELPTHDGHHYDHAKGKVRKKTAAERKAWQEANQPPAPPLSDEDVKRIAAAMKELP